MKKRLLITSIVMMLVVAVALSTATYAWFTSNNSVSATSITMTASTSESAALAIAWVPTGAGDPTFGNYITTGAIDSSTTKFGPVAPTTTDANTAFASMTFASSTIKTLDNRNYFNSTPTAVAPDSNSDVYVWNDGETTASTEIRLKNMSSANATGTITIKAVIEDNDDNDQTDNGVDLIRVAVFKKDGSTYKLVGIMATSNSQKVAYGTIAAPANAASPTAYETAEVKMHISGQEMVDTTPTDVTPVYATAMATGLNLGTLTATTTPATNTMDLKVIVWMDGQALGDSQGGLAAKISLNITAA